MLLLQGLDDPVVPPQQSESIAADLAAHGIRHAYIAFEGESHGFRKAETIIASLEAELSFYGQILGFTPPGVPVVKLTAGGAPSPGPGLAAGLGPAALAGPSGRTGRSAARTGASGRTRWPGTRGPR